MKIPAFQKKLFCLIYCSAVGKNLASHGTDQHDKSRDYAR